MPYNHDKALSGIKATLHELHIHVSTLLQIELQ